MVRKYNHIEPSYSRILVLLVISHITETSSASDIHCPELSVKPTVTHPLKSTTGINSTTTLVVGRTPLWSHGGLVSPTLVTVLSVLGVSTVIVIFGFLGGIIFSKRLARYRRRKAKKMHTCRTAVFARELARGESVSVNQHWKNTTNCVLGIDGMAEEITTVSL